MNDDIIKYLTALKTINLALLEGLRLAVYVLENEDKLSPEIRASNIRAIKNLIEKSEAIYKEVPIQNKV